MSVKTSELVVEEGTCEDDAAQVAATTNFGDSAYTFR